MRRYAIPTAAALTICLLAGGVSAQASGSQYSLACKFVWTKLNNAPLVIQVQPVTDVFFVDVGKSTVDALPGKFSETNISWIKTANTGDQVEYLADTSTGHFSAFDRSVNPITGTPVLNEYDGQCERLLP